MNVSGFSIGLRLWSGEYGKYQPGRKLFHRYIRESVCMHERGKSLQSLIVGVAKEFSKLILESERTEKGIWLRVRCSDSEWVECWWRLVQSRVFWSESLSIKFRDVRWRRKVEGDEYHCRYSYIEIDFCRVCKLYQRNIWSVGQTWRPDHEWKLDHMIKIYISRPRVEHLEPDVAIHVPSYLSRSQTYIWMTSITIQYRCR